MASAPNPNQDDRRRYRRWVQKLQTVKRLCGAMEYTHETRDISDLRWDIRCAAEDLDVLLVPPRWKSWEKLGEAIYGDW